MPITFFITGDFAPKGLSLDWLKSNGDNIMEEMKPFIKEADYSIVNLEAPFVSNGSSPIKKSGPCLGVSNISAKLLASAGFNVVTLANNHFFDQGQEGVELTIDACKQQNLKVVGGGKTSFQARQPLLLEKNGVRVALINACEHEFSIATDEHGGSNPLDIINVQEDISELRNRVDFIILILHGGIEQYHYPTPRMQRWFRHFIDIGADVVINHHQHCINGFELYEGKPIFYGLGNFYFPWEGNVPDSWYHGYAVKLILDDNIDYKLIPYKQTKDALIIRDICDFKKEIELYNKPINDNTLLQEKFNEYVMTKGNALKAQLLPSFLSGRYLSALARHGWLGCLYKDNNLLAIKNKITCESHLELLQRLFSELIK